MDALKFGIGVEFIVICEPGQFDHLEGTIGRMIRHETIPSLDKVNVAYWIRGKSITILERELDIPMNELPILDLTDNTPIHQFYGKMTYDNWFLDFGNPNRCPTTRYPRELKIHRLLVSEAFNEIDKIMRFIPSGFNATVNQTCGVQYVNFIQLFKSVALIIV